MGMYTGLRCRVIIKPEYREEIEKINKGLEWEDSQYGLFRMYGDDPRAGFIPRGALSYMPWGDDEFHWQRKMDIRSGVWQFQCSLKDYDDTIQSFFDDILPEIASEIIYLEKYYEEWCYGKLYELKDGKIVEVGKGPKYPCYEY